MVLEMSDRLRREFDSLVRYATVLEVRWRDYETLFRSDQARVDILNGIAPQFFAHIEDSLWTSVLLDLTKITAIPRSMGHESLTLQRLPSLVHGSIRADVRAKVKAAVNACRFAKGPRNNLIAHWNLKAVNEVRFDTGSRNQVNRAIDAVGVAIHSVLEPYDWMVWERHPDHQGKGFATDLISVLENGRRK